MGKPTPEERAFAKHLKQLLENESDPSAARAAMAHLRRGLGKPPGMAPEMDRYILPVLPPAANARVEEAYYTVASLFAYWHQGRDKVDERPPATIGASLRTLVNKEEDAQKRENLEKSIEKRLTALLNCHRDNLPEHLRHIVALLKTKEVPLDWAQLLRDINGWDQDSRIVQHSWAKGFWQKSAEVLSDQQKMPD